MVVLKRWANAPHCEIGRTDPEGYCTALRDFLNPGGDIRSGAGDGARGGAAANNIKPWDRD